MKRVLIKCGWLVTLDPRIGEMKDGELLYRGNTIEAAGRNLGATADEVIDASDKIVMPGLVNAHMHTWETALRGIGAEWMSADYFKHVHSNLATRYQPEDNYIANLMGALAQIDAGVTTLVDWCHNITGIELAERAVDGLVDSGIRAVFARHRQAADRRGREAVHRHPASARAHRSAAQGPPGGRRRPRHPRHGHTRSGLGQLGGGRARHPHGARARPGVVVTHTAAGGLRRARRLSAHGRGGAARAGPQSRAWHQL
jgi:cytosine/adenosine deaminase-related metal-dependent hydrolase